MNMVNNILDKGDYKIHYSTLPKGNSIRINEIEIINKEMDELDLSGLNIYFDSCRSNTFIKLNKSENKLKKNPIIQVYKDIVKNILKIKNKINKKNQLLKIYDSVNNITPNLRIKNVFLNESANLIR